MTHIRTLNISRQVNIISVNDFASNSNLLQARCESRNVKGCWWRRRRQIGHMKGASEQRFRCSCRIEVQTISWFHRVKLSWNCHEIVMKLSSSWNCRAIVMKLSWNCHEIVVILSSYSPIIILSSNCREMVIIFSCRSSYCHEIVIKWTSNCPQNFQAQLTDI